MFTETLFVALSIIIITTSTSAENVCSSKLTTIYNIREGVLLLGNSLFTSKEIQSKPIVEVRYYGSNAANWYTHYVKGYRAFVNAEYQNYCLTFYRPNKLVELKRCTFADNQLFEVVALSSGDNLIKVKGQDQCLYVYLAIFNNYYTFADTCPSTKISNKWLWAFLPEYQNTVSTKYD